MQKNEGRAGTHTHTSLLSLIDGKRPTLASTAPAIADGAWGTELQKLGLPVGDCPDEWNLTRPDAVRGVAESYLRAGSQFILTNTFGANPFQLSRHGLEKRMVEINQAGARISVEMAALVRRETGRDDIVVLGDIGPSGKLLLMGDVTEEELFAGFSAQAKALVHAGVQGLIVETMSDVEEMAIAVRAARSTRMPVVASMTFDRNAHGEYHTMMGNTPALFVERANLAGATAIGANCGTGIESYVSLAAQLRKLTDKPVWIKANAGMPELVDGKAVYSMDPEDYCSYAAQIILAGVDMIGGCCGTDPRFIAAIAKKLRASERA